jgi:general secretion pathway protein G
MRRAFTMIELVFVIVVIGILGMIAIPKFSATRDDATVTKAKTTVANIRTALSSEVQARILKANYTPLTNVGGTIGVHNSDIFDFFGDAGGQTTDRVLEYPPKSCKDASARACWMRTGASTYKYYFPSAIGGDVTFTVNGGRFTCDGTSKCKYLER